MANDSLARGARSATFPSNSHIAQDKWDSIFGVRPLNITKKVKRSEAKAKPRKSS